MSERGSTVFSFFNSFFCHLISTVTDIRPLFLTTKSRKHLHLAPYHRITDLLPMKRISCVFCHSSYQFQHLVFLPSYTRWKYKLFIATTVIATVSSALHATLTTISLIPLLFCTGGSIAVHSHDFDCRRVFRSSCNTILDDHSYSAIFPPGGSISCS